MSKHVFIEIVRVNVALKEKVVFVKSRFGPIGIFFVKSFCTSELQEVCTCF